MAWERRVNRVMDHVRSNLTGDLSLNALAGVAYASRFHFARIFKAITGETLVHFVQRARLERAATLMIARPDRELADVALQAGFGSPSDFSRVFRQHYGVPPSQWDRLSRLTPGLPDVDAPPLLAGDDGTVYPPRWRDYEACRVGYVRVATPFFDNGILEAGYRVLVDWFEARGVDWRASPLLGMSWDHFETTPIDQVRFDLGFPLPEGLRADSEVSERALPRMHTVSMRVVGPRKCIAVAWDRLYSEVLPRSSREPADLPGIKRFRRQPQDWGWDRFDLDCTIALR